MELNKIFVGIIFGIVIFIGMFFFLADTTTQYGITPPAGYNDSYTEFRQVLDHINQTSDSVKKQILDIPTQAGLADYLGFFFNSGYQALKAAGTISTDMFRIGDVSVDILVPGQMGGIVKMGLLASVAIIIFIGILMHAVVKDDRL